MPVIRPRNVTMPLASATSAELDLEDVLLVGFVLPATFNGTTLTFTGNINSSTFYPIYDLATGNLLSFTVAHTRAFVVDPKTFAGFQSIKFVSGDVQADTDTIIECGVINSR